ncbi:DUF4209 domain-containing protein [Pallidibacillus thermolactis]|jgi:Domain of unknown function (DUF4209)|uniref:DUF4209 domain-containing protein n=1 Tax=Pallidibacillus thermolactis TaxID=251051 RepID=UPI0021D9D76F|nr:DUF4209 domain-containing protein [Pallidibacillus thermolactis]MCU9601359.1 DUF4209 domain-containing protein [Pallidibacillus thermolactis subsp. kokeshiiformis]
MNSSLVLLLKRLDEERESLAEFEIANKIERNFDGDKSDIDFISEIIAFDLTPDYEAKKGSWGFYYGPKYLYTNEDGSTSEYPSLSSIDAQMINYWTKRIENTNNPIMRARYADLVWEFSKHITGESPSHKIAQEVVDNNILIVKEKLYKYKNWAITKLERALNVALTIRDNSRIECVKETIIETEDRIAEDDKPGLWGFSFDLLLDNKKIKLKDEEIEKIINDLENRVSRLRMQDEADPWAVEAAAIRLARYYQKNNKREEVIRVMKEVEKEYIKKGEDASPIQVQAWMENLHELFLQFQMNKEAEGIRKKLNELGPQVIENLSTISHSMEISEQEINDFVNLFLSDDIYKDIAIISYKFVPKKDQIEQQVLELSEASPLSFFITKSLLGEDGRTVAKIGSLEEDFEGNIIQQITQNLNVQIFFLNKVLDKFFEHHSLDSEKLLRILMESPIFNEDKKELLQKGIEMYFNEDYIAAIHILIPQIEAAFRRLINLSGGVTLKPSKNYGGFRVKLFGEILSDPIIEEVFSEDHKLYFKVLFVDPRGLNLRNNVSHSLNSVNTFNKANANLLIHVLFNLSLVRYVEKK